MEQLDPTRLQDALALLGETLALRGERHEIVVIGGSGLLLLGLVRRATFDVDVVARVDEGALVSARPLPAALVAAAQDVARVLAISPDWVNPGPTALLEFGLPDGMIDRCESRRYGTLIVRVASRLDQIHFKLYASADHGPRSKHVADLRALAPTRDELLAAARWSRSQDPSAGFADALRNALAHFGVEGPDANV